MLKLIVNNNYLLRQLVVKDIKQRYQGSVLGILWSFAVPIIMLVIYTFMFSVIFQAKWDVGIQDKYQFALVLFCGLSAFNLISEVMNRATSIIITNTNYVKKVIFPLELLPIVLVFSALFNCLISYFVLIVAELIIYKSIPSTVLLFFIAIIPLIILAIGISLCVSAISVYLRDVANFISIFVTVLMYVSPIFFPLNSVPERFKIICEINPMTYNIENMRNVMLYGNPLNLKFYAISLLIAIIFYFMGLVIFKRAKEGFADVL